ncbi:MAG: DUF5686 family protein [Mucilaginibacter sp.]
MRFVWISISLLFLFLKTSAQTVALQGIISDDHDKPLSFVSAWFDQIHQGVLTNDQGFYRINLQPGTYRISFRSPGYNPLFKNIVIQGPKVNLDLQLSQINKGAELSGNADSIIQRVIAMQNTFPDRFNTYSGSLYTKQLQRVDEVPNNFLKNGVAYGLSMAPISMGIINLSESLAEFQIRARGFISEEVTASIVRKNSKEIFNFNKVPELHIDFYQNTVHLFGLSEVAFVSPLSDNALTYYRYFLIAQFSDEQRLIDEIRVQPVRPDKNLFSGTIYIIDKEWQLYGAELQLSRGAKIDFIDSVGISQQYTPASHGIWLNQASRLRFYGNFWGFRYSGLFLQVYRDIHSDSLKTNIYSKKYRSAIKDYKKDNNFWDQNRSLPLTPDEQHFYLLAKPDADSKTNKTFTDSIQNRKNRFRLLPYLLLGYSRQNYARNSSLAVQAPYNAVFYNTVEGWGIDFKVKYTKIYDRLQSITIMPDFRYGFSDKVFNANVMANYVYNSFRHASVYGRIGTDFLDLNNTGTISSFLNSLTTLYLRNNYLKLYQSRFIMAGTNGEVTSGILLNGQLEYADRSPLFNTTLHAFNKDSVLLTSNNPLDPNSNKALFPRHQALTLRGSATFTFNQEYRITPDGRFILPTLYPVIRLNYRKGISALGSSVNYDFISIDAFQDKLAQGTYGYTAFYLSAGKFLNNKNIYYPDYNHFHGGQSFFIDASSAGFHFLNYYTYSTDRAYFEAHAEHNFTGVFLSHVLLLKKFGLEEIIGGSYLNQGTLPEYKEIYVGLKRTLLRLDYGFAFGRFTKVVQGFRLTYNFSSL